MILSVEDFFFVIFSFVGEFVLRSSRNEDSLDGEFSVWSVGSSLNCKEGEFEKARLSIIATDEEIFDCGVENGIGKEWGCFLHIYWRNINIFFMKEFSHNC